MNRIPKYVVAVACLLPLPAAAQTRPPAAGTAKSARPTVTAKRVSGAPRVDGRLDEAVWRDATSITQFTQQRPVEGAAATEATEIYVAYDDAKLYFGIYAHYSDPALIRANRVDRDQTASDDTVAISFDTFLDQQRGYSFSVNGYGVQSDMILAAANAGGGQSATGDATWNALYESAGVLVEDGWTAEMAIPIKSLRYPSRGPGEAHRWGFQVLREIKSKDEIVTWAPVSTSVLGFLPQMGVLDGVTNLSTRRNFELLPTLTAIGVGRLTPAGEFADDDVQEAGINAKYGVTSNLTLDFTYNPDFSQIESDRPQIEVNQRFPLIFAELRPFFLEGKEIYQIAGPITHVHTRTVVDPRYGAKLTGKIGRTQIGVIVADDEAPGKVDDRSSPLYGRSAQSFMGRVKQDIYRESHLGVLFTDREFMQSYSRLGMVDGGFRLGASARYVFQFAMSDRRDLNGVRRTGPVLNMDFRKEGRNLTYFGAHNEIHPEFGNDLGFLRRVDQKQTVGSVNYRWWPEKWIINWGPGARYDRLHDYDDGILTDERMNGSVNVQFVNNVSVTANVDRNLERYRDLDFWKSRFSISTRINTSRRISVSADMNRGDEIRFIVNPYLGRTTAYNATIVLRPSSRVQSEVLVNTTRFVDVRSDRVDFDVKVYRALTTYQFTERFVIRNILEGNTLNKTIGVNLLGTYRVNAGTVFFVGYDDRYRQGNQISTTLFPQAEYQRTNRAVFAKLQYLFRY